VEVMKAIPVLLFFVLFSCGKPESGYRYIDDDGGERMNYPTAIRLHNELLLTAEFDECGEWGGHKESIRFKRDGLLVYATLKRDSIVCQGEVEDHIRITLDESSIVLSYEMEVSLKHYLNNLNTLYMERGGYWFYPPTYTATFSDSSYYVRVGGYPWDEFEKLRNKLCFSN
jgi:hypothetical protein